MLNDLFCWLLLYMVYVNDVPLLLMVNFYIANIIIERNVRNITGRKPFNGSDFNCSSCASIFAMQIKLFNIFYAKVLRI